MSPTHLGTNFLVVASFRFCVSRKEVSTATCPQRRNPRLARLLADGLQRTPIICDCVRSGIGVGSSTDQPVLVPAGEVGRLWRAGSPGAWGSWAWRAAGRLLGGWWCSWPAAFGGSSPPSCGGAWQAGLFCGRLALGVVQGLAVFLVAVVLRFGFCVADCPVGGGRVLLVLGAAQEH